MKHLCLFILSFSGVLSVALCKAREYVLIKQMMTWTDAQVYCRMNHVDLATVQTAEEQINLRQTADESAFTSIAWIGFYNDVNSWRWSHQDKSVTFTKWYPGQPDNYGAGEECVVLRFDRLWADIYCTSLRHFLCFDEKNSTVKYYLITQPKTWSDAQTYCRDRYVDLVTIRNETENELLTHLMYWSGEVWIGLFRDDWKWADQSNLSSTNELAARNLNGANENCGLINYYGYFDDWLCSITLNFYCNTVKLKRQIVKIQVKSNVVNMNDVLLKTLVSQKLQDTLSGLMADGDVFVTWRKHLNGKYFEKIKDVPKSANGSSICYDQSF